MDYWNHNTAYYPWIKKETSECRSMLDVGCGDGTLIDFLDDGTKLLTGIDVDGFCIDRANNKKKSDNVAFLCKSFEDLDYDRKYDAITFVASLHHMEMKSTVEKAKSLLNDGGKLLIVGLAAPSGFCDYIIEALRVIPCFIISKIKRMKTSESRNIPVSYAFPDMNEVRRVLGELLPGHTLRYGLFYRYLLTWEKNL